MLFLCLALLHPPPAEAVEETPSKGTVIFKFISLTDGGCSADYAVDFYGDDDYYISSQPIHFHFPGLVSSGKIKTVRYNIPAEAKIVVLRDGGWNGGLRRMVWGKFKLEESSEFSSGCIEAVVRCGGIIHHESWSKGSKSSGCWKQIQD